MMLRYFLQNQFPVGAVCPWSDWGALLRTSADDLAAFALFQGHFVAAARELLPPVDVITFVREPIERTLSLMLHLRRDPAFHVLHERARHLSIAEMLDDSQIVQHLSNQQTTYLGSSIDFVAVRHALASGRLNFDIGEFMSEPDLGAATQVLASLSMVGLTERMEESMARLCQRFDFHPSFEYQKRNAASQADRSRLEGLPTSVLERLREMNELDIQLYETAQSIFQAQAPAPTYDVLVRGSLARHPVFAGSMPRRIDLSGPLAGTNWYEPEWSSDQPSYRWSGPSGTSSFEWPLSIEGFDAARIEVFALPGRELASCLTLRFDGIEVAPAFMVDSDRCVFDVPILANSLSAERGFHQLVLTHAAEVSEPGNGDQRILHFGLASITFLSLSEKIRQWRTALRLSERRFRRLAVALDQEEGRHQAPHIQGELATLRTQLSQALAQAAVRRADELAGLKAASQLTQQALDRAQQQILDREAEWAARYERQEQQWQQRWDTSQRELVARQVEAVAAQARVGLLTRDCEQAIQRLDHERREASQRQQADATRAHEDAEGLRARHAVALATFQQDTRAELARTQRDLTETRHLLQQVQLVQHRQSDEFDRAMQVLRAQHDQTLAQMHTALQQAVCPLNDLAQGMGAWLEALRLDRSLQGRAHVMTLQALQRQGRLAAAALDAAQFKLAIPERGPVTLPVLMGLDDKSFIQKAYLAVLHREPDAEGQAHYLSCLRQGMPRLRVLSDLRLSEEGQQQVSALEHLDDALLVWRQSRWPVFGRRTRQHLQDLLNPAGMICRAAVALWVGWSDYSCPAALPAALAQMV